MKTRITFFTALFLLTCSIAISKVVVTGNNLNQDGSINVLTSPDLYNLTMKWASEYNRLNPALKITVTKSPENNISGILPAEAGIAFISNASHATMNNPSVWSMVVGRDVIVPVMNAKNPFLNEINRKGITAEKFAGMLANPEKQNWGVLMGNGQNIPIHCYISKDGSIKSGLADFLKINKLNIDEMMLVNGQEILPAMEKDPNALGFCRLVDIIDPINQNLADNIRLVPIDKNGNGKIDFMEDIYDNLQAFSRGVWIGKYPKALSGNIYSVALQKPNNPAEVAFLKWVLTDGQQFLSTNGFSDLVYNERQSQMDKLNDPAINLAGTHENDTYAMLKVVLMVVIVLAVFGFIVSAMISRFRNHKESVPGTEATPPSGFDENSVNIPKGLYFDKTHTWAFMEKDGTVKLGIDDFLQHVTGPLSSIGMKPVGVKIKKGDPLITIIQKGKHLLIHSPVSGTITANNQTLITNLGTLNTAPYSDGWVYTIEPTNWPLEIQFLWVAERYKTWLKGEFSRLKDFLATAINASTPEYAYVPLQDGGILKDSILADLGPEVWEDFQTKFIDNVK